MQAKDMSRKIMPALVGGALSVVLSTGHAASQTEYTGGGFISDFSAQCQADGWSGTNQIVARHRPAGLPGNPTASHVLNLFFDSYTLHFEYPTGAQGQWLTTTSAASIGGTYGVQTTPRPQVRLQPAPEGTTFTEQELHLVADINHFSYTSNCQARVNLWLYRR